MVGLWGCCSLAWVGAVYCPFAAVIFLISVHPPRARNTNRRSFTPLLAQHSQATLPSEVPSYCIIMSPIIQNSITNVQQFSAVFVCTSLQLKFLYFCTCPDSCLLGAVSCALCDHFVQNNMWLHLLLLIILMSFLCL